MATAILPPSGLPGFHHSPSFADLRTSSRMHYRYNNLNDDSEQPEVTADQLQALAELFTRHNAQDIFGVHLVHGHFQIDEDTIMLGIDLGTDSLGYWTHPVKSAKVDKDNIHGHIYVLSTENQFVAYEYRGGPVTDTWKHVHTSFFPLLAQHLLRNSLTGVLGLQVLDHQAASTGEMLEFVLGEEGTARLRAPDANHGGMYRITGWSFRQDNDGIVSVSGRESHAQTTKNTHRVFIGSKPLPTIDAVKNVLRDEGII
ncbi:hypothetical protein MMC19_004156 [Ptychographa xylographoides]|nr:hypothetical protein [Ptychographa xylographoides]